MSNINVSGIDTNYPIAGRDNDSQGFRDNFAAIKSAIEVAASEIDELQAGTVKLSATNLITGTMTGGTYLSPQLDSPVANQVVELYNKANVASAITLSPVDTKHWELTVISGPAPATAISVEVSDWTGNTETVVNQFYREFYLTLRNNNDYDVAAEINIGASNILAVNNRMPVTTDGVSVAGYHVKRVLIAAKTATILKLETLTKGQTVIVSEIASFDI